MCVGWTPSNPWDAILALEPEPCVDLGNAGQGRAGNCRAGRDGARLGRACAVQGRAEKGSAGK